MMNALAIALVIQAYLALVPPPASFAARIGFWVGLNWRLNVATLAVGKTRKSEARDGNQGTKSRH